MSGKKRYDFVCFCQAFEMLSWASELWLRESGIRSLCQIKIRLGLLLFLLSDLYNLLWDALFALGVFTSNSLSSFTTISLVAISVALLSKALSTEGAWERSDSRVDAKVVLETAESSELQTTASMFAGPDFVHPPGLWISSIVHRVFIRRHGLEPLVA